MASVNSDITLNTGTDKLRNDLYARNLYAPDTEYPLQNEKNVDRVVGALNTVIKGITPFSSYDLTNTVYGRLITTSTPLTQVGLEMLGKQFALNSMSSIAQNNFPTIKVANLFDGSTDTKLFTKKKNFSITKKEGQTNFQTFLNNAVYYYPGRDYPFDKDNENSDFIKNTGPAQLNIMYKNINRNIYKQNDDTLYEYADVAETQIFDRNNITANRIWFNYNDGKFDPYAAFTPYPASLIIPNGEMVLSAKRSSMEDEFKQEYAPNTAFIDIYLGETNKTQQAFKGDLSIPEGNSWIDENVEFSNDKLQNKVVWGIGDDVTNTTKDKLDGLRPGESPEAKSSGIDSNNLSIRYNIRAGLLAYTKNLVNATEGRIGDITRKAFIDKKGKVTGFQGAGLWKSNRSVYATARQLAGKTGTRQHTAIDQYDRFAKAIRFNGNEVYNGSPNSVIYKSVLPKIHPIIDENTVDSTDMMFSIENLAVIVRKDENYAILEDEWVTAIPLCEAGPFGGRVMWFPPYNLEINESATAKYEPTVMIGRNEPMYNYMYSERGAQLSFSLIIDYPEQLKNFKGGDRQRQIAEFFAFGGEEFIPNTKKTVEDLELKITRLQLQIDTIQGGTKVTEPDLENPSPLNVYFPNDVPKVTDNINTVINKMYNDYKYEIFPNSVSSDGGTKGINKQIYFISGMTDYIVSGKTFYSASTVVDQYNVSHRWRNQFAFGIDELNKMLTDTYSNVENRPLYDINIVGTASKLYTEQDATDVAEEETYNNALGDRRAEAVEKLVEARLLAIFPEGDVNVTINLDSTGSEGASAEGATAAAIPLLETKYERSASITVKRNNDPRPLKEVPLSEADRVTIIELQKEIEAATTELKRLKGLAEGCVYEQRPIPDNESGAADTGILHGFKGVSGNYYQPAFHSQTPEDFHKRLTFLQQCTRQGSAKKYDLVNEDGNLRAKNSVFGRQPICIMRVGDFFNTKIVLETVTVDYADTPWDMNPEGFGMQPMIANVTLNMKLIGGQSLKGPIDALQNANSYNFYANSSFTSKGRYELPSRMADEQQSYREAVMTAANNLREEESEVEN